VGTINCIWGLIPLH